MELLRDTLDKGEEPFPGVMARIGNLVKATFGTIPPEPEHCRFKEPILHNVGLFRAVYLLEDPSQLPLALMDGFINHGSGRVDTWYKGERKTYGLNDLILLGH